MGHQGSVCGRFFGRKSTGEVTRWRQGDAIAGAVVSSEGRAGLANK
jgi:hypothetical protein